MENLFSLRAAALVVCVAALGGTASGHVDRQTAYRTHTDLVRVTATVSDATGKAVMTLEQQDFSIFDDDQPQEIALFTRDSDTPLSIAIVLDVSGSMKQELETVRTGLRAYIEGLREDDEVGLVLFGGRVHRVADLTTARDGLLAALDGAHASGGTPLYAGMVEATRMLDAARHQKKVLLLITDGNNTGLRSSRHSAARAVEHSEALVYALGIGHAGRDTLLGRIVAVMNGPRMGLLHDFADASGGRAEMVDDVNGAGHAAVAQMIAAFGDELRQQYTIGYYPPARPGSKTVHQIRVTTRHADETVRARKLYLSTPPP